MRSAVPAAAGLVVASFLVACTSIGGLDELVFAEGSTTSSAGATADGGAGAGSVGGMGGSAVGGGTGGVIAVCGDGSVDGAEECDDRNLLAGDGCDECIIECEPGPDEAKHPETGHCYIYLGQTNSTYAEGRAACQDLNAHLPVVTTADEHDYVLGRIDSSIWLGLDDIITEADFRWVNGEPFSYEAWDSTEPNGGDVENCVEQNFSSMLWRDEPCSDVDALLCERGDD